MENDSIKTLFENLKGEFDINEAHNNHEFRFLNKLKAVEEKTIVKRTARFNWKPLLVIAATIIICLTVVITLQYQPQTSELASVSPELSETQNFFTSTIENELKTLNKERSPLTEDIINDALSQIKGLENEYNKLKIDLPESGNDQRVIYAMIANFQSRIDVLNTVLEQVNYVKQFKIKTNDNKNTI